MHLTNFVDYTCVKNDAFCSRGLASVDVGCDTNVARVLQGEWTLGRVS